jgi:hypothetical protein
VLVQPPVASLFGIPHKDKQLGSRLLLLSTWLKGTTILELRIILNKPWFE